MNLVEEYGSYVDIRKKLKRTGELIPYDWIDCPHKWPISYMAYSQMLDEHSRELANSINQIRRLTASLEAWDKLLSAKADDDQKLKLIVEFIDPLATVAINLPYVIRSRFIYSIAHLSHQANQTQGKEWKDDLPIDTEIYFKQADNYASRWRSYKKLKISLEHIAGGAYAAETCDFRNKYNHRYSPRIEIGLTELVTRQVDSSGKVRYAFGHTGALKLANLVEALKKQHEFCAKTFSLYQTLIDEQIAAIKCA